MRRTKAIVVKEKTPKHRIAIKLNCKGGIVRYMPLMTYGIEIHRMTKADFDTIFCPIPDYPTERAAKLYVGTATKLGGTSEAMAELAKIVHVTKQEKEMAGAATKKKGKGSATTKKTKPKGGGAKADKKPRESAAAMFKTLIMKGGQTDDQIFNEVKKKFKLDDDKRSYVAWYRNSLKKAGKNPPAAKGGEKKKTKATTKKK